MVTRKKTKTKAKRAKAKAPAMVEFTPERSLPITINGKTIEVHAGVKMQIPPEYKAVYDSAS